MKSKRLAEITDPAHAGLLIIDLQVDFMSSDGKDAICGKDVSAMQQIVPKLESLIHLFHEHKRPIIWTKNYEDPKYRTSAGLDRYLWLEDNDLQTVACLENTPGAELYMKPGANDIIVQKTRISAYVKSGLPEIIRQNNLKTLFVTGVKTQRCVAVTVHDLYENEPDLHIVTVEDCVASDDATQHDTAIAELKEFFPPVITSRQLIDTWKRAE